MAVALVMFRNVVLSSLRGVSPFCFFGLSHFGVCLMGE